MPAALTYPGVYIEEVPSGVHTIIGVATSITVFIGRAQRGPTNSPIRIQSFADFERVFGGLWMPSTLGYAVQHYFLNGGSDALIVRVHHGAAASTLTIAATATSGPLKLVAASEGVWGDRLRVRIDHIDPKDLSEGENADTLFNIAVRDTATGATERYLNVSVVPNHGRYVKRVLETQSNLIRIADASDALGDKAPPANPQLATLGADPFDSVNSTSFSSGTGSDGGDLDGTEIAGADGLQSHQQGLYALEQADLFNLLCIPPLARQPDGSTKTEVPNGVWNAAAAYCAGRRAILIVDSPESWNDPSKAISGLTDVITRTDSAALYFPRIRATDPLKDFRQESFAPGGAIAGVIARTDATRGVWKAPAGLDATLTGVSALSLGGEPGLLTDPQIGLLNPLGINCLRTVPNTGQVVWGARTLEGSDQLASEWKYLPVRRLAYFIEESLFRGTQWAVFEPNDEPLWAQLRLNVGTFMQGLFRQGAFQGASPRDAYFVKCSHETTTQADIDAGIVNVLVGFAPLKPAEFVVIRIQQITQQTP